MASKERQASGLGSVEISPHGRKSRVKRLISSLSKDTIARLTKKSPEVMVKVSGGGKTAQHVMAHLSYITRNGQLDAVNDEADRLAAKDELQELMNEWGLDIAKGQGQNKLVFNIVLSMPVGTDPHKLHQAVKDFSRAEFYGQRQYLMVLHEPDTDPSKKKAEHPHVHLVINAQGYDGKRIYIRKPMLEKWREQFAEKLRDQGIDANATPRQLRGVIRKSKSLAVKAMENRKVSDVVNEKFQAVRKEIDNPSVKGNVWNRFAKAKRKQLVSALDLVAKTYEKNGDQELAIALNEFKETLPSAITERELMQGFVHAVKARREPAIKVQSQTQEKTSNSNIGKGADNDKKDR